MDNWRAFCISAFAAEVMSPDKKFHQIPPMKGEKTAANPQLSEKFIRHLGVLTDARD